NRDPRRWDDPGRFSIERAPDGHLAFGGGIHFCVGAPLVRLEAVTFLRLLLERTEGMEPAGERVRVQSPTFRGIARLPLRLTPRRV
ncbi:cytochrome P450, partial [Streptosporangium algeriense]